jgi:hypothetical protein
VIVFVASVKLLISQAIDRSQLESIKRLFLLKLGGLARAVLCPVIDNRH